MNNPFVNEPVAIVNGLTSLLKAAVAALVAFGVFKLTVEQAAALAAVIVPLEVLLNAIFVRNRVTPVANPRDSQGNPLRPV